MNHFTFVPFPLSVSHFVFMYGC